MAVAVHARLRSDLHYITNPQVGTGVTAVSHVRSARSGTVCRGLYAAGYMPVYAVHVQAIATINSRHDICKQARNPYAVPARTITVKVTACVVEVMPPMFSVSMCT
jgi:hypothetical protein